MSRIARLGFALAVMAELWHELWRSSGGPEKRQTLACPEFPDLDLLWQLGLKYGTNFGTPLAHRRGAKLWHALGSPN
uniref:Putative secreted protein n=1 Tax=Ixodes ricinus TaxID=34613 RepID=A0A6B0U5T8_IXORI